MNVKKNWLIVCMLFIVPANLMAQTRYWVPGGDGNWNSPNNWSEIAPNTTNPNGISGASVPTINNDVVFNNTSFSASSYTVTLTGPASCKNMTWTGVANNPILAMGANALTIDGSLTLSSNAMSITGTGSLTFTSATAGQTISTKNKTLPAMLFNSSAPTTGGWTFLDAVTVTGQIGLQAGSLNTDGMAVSAFLLDASDPSVNAYASATSDLTRTLTLGNSTVTLSGYTNTTTSNYIVLDLGGNNLSLSEPGASSKIIFSGQAPSTFVGVFTGNNTKTLPDLEFGTSTNTGPNNIDMFVGSFDTNKRITFRNITVRRTDGVDFFLNGTCNLTFGNLTFPNNVFDASSSLTGEKYIIGGPNNEYNGAVTFGDNCTFTFYKNCPFSQPVTFGNNCNISFWSDLTPSSTFTTNASTIILRGGGFAQTVSLPAGQSLYNLTLNRNSATSQRITLNSNLTITKTLTLNMGHLNTSTTNTLIIPDGATVAGGSNSSHVIGPVRKEGTQSFTFPTGDGTFYRPISISAPASSTTAFTATYYKANPLLTYGTTLAATLDRISKVEYWTLDRSVNADAVQVTLFWNTASQVGNLPTLRVSRYNGATWLDHGGLSTGTVANGSITTGLLNSFSPFTLASTDATNPLPVSLLTFAGRWTDGQVELNWLTSSEKENAYFEVERSANGLNYEAIGRIPGSGTTHERRAYRFLDTRPLRGINYYRLRQVDTNGDFEISKMVAVEHLIAEEAISLSPNPAVRGSVLTLKINASSDQGYLLRLSDMQGRECWRTTVHAMTGPNQFEIGSHSVLPNGLYAVQVMPLSATSASEARFFKITIF